MYQHVEKRKRNGNIIPKQRKKRKISANTMESHEMRSREERTNVTEKRERRRKNEK